MQPAFPLVLGAALLLALFGLGQNQPAPQPQYTPPPRPPRPQPQPAPQQPLGPEDGYWPGEEPWPPRSTPEEPGVYVAESPPQEVATAFIDELASRASGGAQKVVRDLITSYLTLNNPDWSAVVVPCDQAVNPMLPDTSLLQDISAALAEAYGVSMSLIPARWGTPEQTVEVSAVIFHPVGTMMPGKEEIFPPLNPAMQQFFGPGQFRYGDIIGNLGAILIQSLVSGFGGSIGSLAAEDLWHAAGGQRKLNRLTFKYKEALEKGDTRKANRMVNKLTNTLRRLKKHGRIDVNPGDVERLLDENAAKIGA